MKSNSSRTFMFISSLLIFLSINVLGSSINFPDPKGGTITGTILEAATNKPMEYVNIAVFNWNDSSMLTGTITSESGQFRIDKLPLGVYYLRITFLGFDNKLTDKIELDHTKPTKDIGNITLSPSASKLDEVTIVGEKAKVEYQIDKRVINVDESTVAKGGSAVNVLENTPSIQVDPQGNVTLRGSSDYVVLVDGKPSVLKGSDALKQINAASIKQIEVITNPSARYDADGTAGIINVIRKKDQLQGLNGNINTSIGTTDKYTANALVNYRKGKVNVFAGIDFAKNKYRNSIDINNISYLTEGTQHIEESADQYYHNDNLSGKAGIDIDLNDRNSINLSGSYGEQGYDQGTDTRYNMLWFPANGKIFSFSSNSLDVTGRVPEVTLDYTHKFGENHSLSISSYYTSWDGRDINNLVEKSANDLYQDMGTKSALHFIKDNFNYQYRANIDYKKPIKEGSLEVGGQLRYENRTDDLKFQNLDVQTNTWIVNPLYTYKLDYVNNIYSGYATFSNKVLGIGYMLGIRSEYFTRKISFTNDGSKYDFDKFMLYPSVHLSKDLNGKQQFQLSYSRRINRPQPWLLNKQPGYIDPYNVFQGSPILEPEYTDAFEFNYRLMYKITTLSVQTYFRNTRNSFSTLRLLQDSGIMIHQLINANSQKSYGIEAGLDLNFTKWWQVSTGANLYHSTISALVSGSESSKEAYSWDARLISNFSLKWGTRLQAVSYFQGPGIDAQGNTSGFYTVNISVNQPFMKGKGNIGFTAQNVFNSIKFDYTVKSVKYNNDYQIQAEGPILMITASYSFNNFQNKQRGRSDDASFKGGGMF
ncbi:MAG: TonB-dependent receptor [Bacteroidetes bacterium]|nr:TonB-dependent receptor [Bacteroidota bacterium]